MIAISTIVSGSHIDSSVITEIETTAMWILGNETVFLKISSHAFYSSVDQGQLCPRNVGVSLKRELFSYKQYNLFGF